MPRLTKSAALVIRRSLLCTASLLAVILLIIVVLTVGLDSGRFRGPLIQYFAESSGRSLKVDGALKVRVLALHPYVIAEQVTFNNPAWMPNGTTAQIGKLTLIMGTPWFGRPLAVEKLEMAGASLHLVRDGAGHSNWSRNPLESEVAEVFQSSVAFLCPMLTSNLMTTFATCNLKERSRRMR